MKTFKTCLLSVIFFGGALVLSACGGGGGGDSSPTSNVGVGGTNAPSVTFNVSNSQVLVTTSQLSSLASGSGAPGLLKNFFKSENLITFYESDKVGNVAKATTTNPLTNFYSIDANGNIVQAVTGAGNVKVMYTAASPDGAHVYIALDPTDNDTSELIAQYNCGIFKIAVADNSFTCLDTGYLAPSVDLWTRYYAKEIGGGVKPIQFDPSGNVYYLGWKFEVSGSSISYNQQANPVLRQVQSGGTGTSVTSDAMAIVSFLVTKGNTVVYRYYNTVSGSSGLNMYDLATGSTNGLTDAYSSISMYMADHKETLIYGGGGSIAFAQKSANPSYPGGKYTVKLNTSLFQSSSYGNSLAKILAGDDGNLYGLFSDYKATTSGTGSSATTTYTQYLNLYQVLPYDKVVKASVNTSSSDWWSAMNGVELQIKGGWVYYVEKESHAVNAYSARSLIKAVDMATKREISMLTGADYPWATARYDIYNWKLIGNALHFSGFENASSRMIMGKIDTVAMKVPGALASSYLTITPISSVAGAAAQIQDMEAITAQSAPTNDGSNATATLYTDQENLYSASIKFTKLMNKDTVNSGVTFTDTSAVNVVKVWLYNTLHMIVDVGGDADTATVPLNYATSYNVALNSGTITDAWGLPLATSYSSNFTMRPQYGWWQGADTAATDSSGGTITDGLQIGKLALPNGWSGYYGNRMKLAKSASGDFVTPNLRLEFSAKNRSWGNMTLRLINNVCYGALCQYNSGSTDGSWDAWPVTIYMYGGSAYMSYYDGAGNWKYADTYSLGYGLPILNGQWAKYTLEIYGSNVRLTVTPEGGTATTYLSVTDAGPAYYSNWYNNGSSYTLALEASGSAGDVYYFDNIAAYTVDPVTGGSPVLIAGFPENFAVAPFSARVRNICKDNGWMVENCANY